MKKCLIIHTPKSLPFQKIIFERQFKPPFPFLGVWKELLFSSYGTMAQNITQKWVQNQTYSSMCKSARCRLETFISEIFAGVAESLMDGEFPSTQHLNHRPWSFKPVIDITGWYFFPVILFLSFPDKFIYSASINWPIGNTLMKPIKDCKQQEQDYRQKMSACNVSYRHKRSGPKEEVYNTIIII